MRTDYVQQYDTRILAIHVYCHDAGVYAGVPKRSQQVYLEAFPPLQHAYSCMMFGCLDSRYEDSRGRTRALAVRS